MLTLNIGLNISYGLLDNGMANLPLAAAGVLDVSGVEKALDLMFGTGTYEYKLATSTTEPTMVVRLLGYNEVPAAQINTLCHLLGQDCIAVKLQRLYSVGRLIGPRAAAWGTFNNDYFIDYDAI